MILIPEVKELKKSEGFFNLKTGMEIFLPGNDEKFINAAVILKEKIKEITGLELTVQIGTGKNAIIYSPAESNFHDSLEAYKIKINLDGIVLESGTNTGLFRAIQTLIQIIMNCGANLPCLEIDDFPEFSHRGFYHDITRGKVPKLDTLKKLVERCSFYKINELQLYIEHTYAFKKIPELWIDKDALSAEEIVELDKHCRKFHIDLIPSLSTFGHLYELLRIKRFSHLNELEIDASELPLDLWDRMAHYTIDPLNEESFILISSMIEEFLPLFSSRFFNICCDETFDLGKGKNKEFAQRNGIGRLYIDYVKRLAGVVVKHGKIPMMWGDIVLSRPELLDELPKETVFLNWGYGADVKENNSETFARAGVTHYTCPGVQGWSRFANDLETASINIRKMITFGSKHKASGVLVTDWGDCGHVNFPAGSMHGMALGAALSWNLDSFSEIADFDKSISKLEWNDSSGRIVELLRELGSLCFYHFGNLYAWVKKKDCLWFKEQNVKETGFGQLKTNFTRAEQIRNEFIGIKCSGIAQHGPDLDEFIWSASAVKWTLALMIFKKVNEFHQGGTSILSKDELVGEGFALVQSFKQLWRFRNKESELRNVVDTFKEALQKIETI